jgi:hypothetical protein
VHTGEVDHVSSCPRKRADHAFAVKCTVYSQAVKRGMHLAEESPLSELKIMGRRLDFEKASRNHQAKYGLSVKDEAEWMENDTAARWLARNANRASQKADYRR